MKVKALNFIKSWLTVLPCRHGAFPVACWKNRGSSSRQSIEHTVIRDQGQSSCSTFSLMQSIIYLLTAPLMYQHVHLSYATPWRGPSEIVKCSFWDGGRWTSQKHFINGCKLSPIISSRCKLLASCLMHHCLSHALGDSAGQSSLVLFTSGKLDQIKLQYLFVNSTTSIKLITQLEWIFFFNYQESWKIKKV